MSTPPALLGRWNIESMDMWDTEAINLVGQGHVTFDPRGGEMAFICVTISLNCQETAPRAPRSRSPSSATTRAPRSPAAERRG